MKICFTEKKLTTWHLNFSRRNLRSGLVINYVTLVMHSICHKVLLLCFIESIKKAIHKKYLRGSNVTKHAKVPLIKPPQTRVNHSLDKWVMSHWHMSSCCSKLTRFFLQSCTYNQNAKASFFMMIMKNFRIQTGDNVHKK